MLSWNQCRLSLVFLLAAYRGKVWSNMCDYMFIWPLIDFYLICSFIQHTVIEYLYDRHCSRCWEYSVSKIDQVLAYGYTSKQIMNKIISNSYKCNGDSELGWWLSGKPQWKGDSGSVARMMRRGAVRWSEEEQFCRRISKCRAVKAHVRLAYPDNRGAVSGPERGRSFQVLDRYT